MLKKIAEDKFEIVVNTRENFHYRLDFNMQAVWFVYFCKTDNYQFSTTYKFSDFTEDIVYKTDYEKVIYIIKSSINWYINHNIISGSVRRAWNDFSEEYCAALNSIIMLKFQL